MDEVTKTIRRHLLIGWVGLLVFLSLGIALEVMHGLKLQLYLNSKQEMRRLMWTLAHAHGTLLSLVNIAFALTLRQLNFSKPATAVGLVSACFAGAIIAMPVGFFLGGVWHYEGDPGYGIVLVTVGGFLMLLGVGSFLRVMLKTEVSVDDSIPKHSGERHGRKNKKSKR